MIRRVILHGYLSGLVEREYILDVATAAEAVEALCAVTGRSLAPIPGKGRHLIRIPGFETQEELYRRLREDETELHLVPDFSGGKGGFFQIVLGVVAIAIAIIQPEFLFAAPMFNSATGMWTAAGLLHAQGALGFLGVTAGGMLFSGIMNLAQGVLGMMSAAPQVDTGTSATASASEPDPAASLYLGAPQNTTKLGTRIPVLYGRMMAYGHVLSANVNSSELAT